MGYLRGAGKAGVGAIHDEMESTPLIPFETKLVFEHNKRRALAL